MANRRRLQRLNQLLREELSRLIRREVKDPRVEGVTVTGVEVSGDLRHATVHVRTLGDETPVEDAIEGLRSAEGYLRGTLGRELRIRRIPELEFEADRTLERAQRIEELLQEVETGDDDDGGDGGGGS
jgi:ribosome-binding factor A